MMDRLARAMTAAAALLLLLLFAFPLWRIELLAPQYPEGIGMLIRIDDVQGIKEQDLHNINGLNHYIGMKEIHADAIPELRYMPWLVGALIAMGLLVAAWGRRRALAAWLATFLALGLAGLADFWRWAYDYGHDLDPDAIIKVPGMSYTPPIIGTKQLLNFTASSWPSTGAIAAGIAFAIGALALWRSYHRPAARRPAALPLGAALHAAPVLLALLVACAPAGPRAIRYGEEACGYCRMTITDRRFGAQAANANGRIETFDSIECLADYVNAAAAREPLDAMPPEPATRAWVADFLHPGTFVRVDSARFVRLAAASSPMGAGLAAVRADAPAGAVATDGAPLAWRELLASRRNARRSAHAGDVIRDGGAAGAAHAD